MPASTFCPPPPPYVRTHLDCAPSSSTRRPPPKPVFCEAFLDAKLEPLSGRERARRGERSAVPGRQEEVSFDEADASAYAESLQLAAWLLKVCDVLLVVQDWTPDLELWK